MTITDLLIVVVPTIGRKDVCPALERVLASLIGCLPERFKHLRVDIVVEEGCEAGAHIADLVRPFEIARVIIVPRAYCTARGTRFKARANHYAHELRASEGDARDDVWVLHMDDDTSVGPDTVQALAWFVHGQRQSRMDARHLAQGILSYPRDLAPRRLIWLADAVRPGCDVSIFAATTGLGWPLAGLHGELLLVRASVEAEIGWDFGPRTIVEDACFALEFCARFRGRSSWLVGKSYGASPANLADFLRQRERWIWGLLTLAADRSIPLRRRLVLLQAVVVWTCAPLQHPALILMAGILLGSPGTGPATRAVIPFWSLNFALYVWLYWEGLKINARASTVSARVWWEPVALLALLPLFSLWEVAGVVRGTMRFASRRDAMFSVISKPG